MRKVIQLVGRNAGRFEEMQHYNALACVRNGTAAWPEDAARLRNEGVRLSDEVLATIVEEPQQEPETSTETPKPDEASAEQPETETEAPSAELEGAAAAAEGDQQEALKIDTSGWETMHWKQRVALAKRISGRESVTSDEAREIIEAYVAGQK